MKTHPPHPITDIQQSQHKQQLRRHIRALRKQLTPSQQQLAGQQLCQRLSDFIEDFQLAQQPLSLATGAGSVVKIALFLSIDGEINTQPIIEKLWSLDQQGPNRYQVYLPVIHPFNPQQLIFIRYQANTELRRHALGMLEPYWDCRQICPMSQLDILCTPLVAFDPQGYRLGMGGGFYDRTLAGHQRENRPSPLIIGIAHDCQATAQVPTEPWDIRLKHIITPSKHYRLTGINTPEQADENNL